MTRKIKFRFFDGKSMCDDFLISSTGEVGLCEGLSFESGAYFDTDDYKHIIPLQRTGLKDKNGVEIYENDIFGEYSFSGDYKNLYEPVGKVVYDLDLGAYTIEKTNGGREYLSEFISNNKKAEVIGNIYENSDLLDNNTND